MKFFRVPLSVCNFFLLLFALLLIPLQSSYADFVNGGFEDTYTPSGTSISDPITGWTLTGYTFGGTSAVPPTNFNQLGLTASSGHANGISDIIIGTNQTLNDYFLVGSLPTPTLLLPVTGLQTAAVNVRPMHTILAKSGTTGTISGWTVIGSEATAFSQQITVTSADVDPTDGKVHIRFVAAPVLENPSHPANEQPFFAIQLNNITTGRTGSNPLFFQWNYAAQSGVPWITLTQTGTNPGNNISYTYTDFQGYDISPGNAFIHVGDQIELVIVASGCSPGGHDGHLYLDDVSTTIPSGLWITATGPQQTTPGNNVTYTYTYTNSSGSTVNDVQVIVNLPQQGNPTTPPAASTTFVSVTNPTTGTSTSCTGTGPVTCNMGTLLAGQSGTFQLTVNVPDSWLTSTGPVNNGDYPISGSGLSPLLGPLVQTALVAPSSLSNMVANASGLPTTASVGQAYTGSFTCSNTSIASATGDAASATCDITNLPAGLSVAGCTISPSNTTWTEPETIPADQTVTCNVTGTPTVEGTVTATVTANASNNSNSTTNQVNANIQVIGPVDIPATVNGSPIVNPAVVCCGRPVILGPLPVPGSGPTTYSIIGQTGNVNCKIGETATQTYLKLHGRTGSCTIIGTKDGFVSNPLTVMTPT